MTKANLPAKSAPALQTVVLKVFIHCEGCRRKIKRIIYGLDGVEEVSIEAEDGKVSVVGAGIDVKAVLQRLQKHGKHAEAWPNATAAHGRNNNMDVKKPGSGGGGNGGVAAGNVNPGGHLAKKLPSDPYAGLGQLAMFDHDHERDDDAAADEELFEFSELGHHPHHMMPPQRGPQMLLRGDNGNDNFSHPNAKGSNDNKKQQQGAPVKNDELKSCGAARQAAAPAAGGGNSKRGKNKCGADPSALTADFPSLATVAGGGAVPMPNAVMPRQSSRQQQQRRPVMMPPAQYDDWGGAPLSTAARPELMSVQQQQMYGDMTIGGAQQPWGAVNAALRDSADYATHMFSDENANNCRIM